MHFTPHGNVVHTWGCGTNCANFRVYDSSGHVVLEAVASGLEVSPARHLLITFPSLFDAREPVVLYDLDAGRRVFTSKSPDPLVVNAVHWDDRHGSADVDVGDLRGKSRRLRLRAPTP